MSSYLAYLIQVDIAIIIFFFFTMQTLSVGFHIVIVRRDEMFLFTLNEQMVPYQWDWTRHFHATVCSHSTESVQRYSVTFRYGIFFYSFDQSSSIQVPC